MSDKSRCMTSHVERGESLCVGCASLRNSIVEDILDRIERREAKGIESAERREIEETASAARLVSRVSTRSGSVMIYPDSPREDLVEWLVWCDPNGLWRDEDVKLEGYDPMSKRECWLMIRSLCNNP